MCRNNYSALCRGRDFSNSNELFYCYIFNYEEPYFKFLFLYVLLKTVWCMAWEWILGCNISLNLRMIAFCTSWDDALVQDACSGGRHPPFLTVFVMSLAVARCTIPYCPCFRIFNTLSYVGILKSTTAVFKVKEPCFQITKK